MTFYCGEHLLWRARVSRCLAFFLASLFSPDTGKYGDQIAIRNPYNIEGRIAFLCSYLSFADIQSVYLWNCVRNGFANYFRNRNIDFERLNFSVVDFFTYGCINFWWSVRWREGRNPKQNQNDARSKQFHQWDPSGRAAANTCRGKGERKQARKWSGPDTRFVRHTHLVVSG